MNSYFLVTDKTRAYEVVEPHVYVNEATALAGAKTSTFTLNEPGKVGFALLDLTVAIGVGVSIGLALRLYRRSEVQSDWTPPDR